MIIYETIKAAISVKQAAEHYGLSQIFPDWMGWNSKRIFLKRFCQFTSNFYSMWFSLLVQLVTVLAQLMFFFLPDTIVRFRRFVFDREVGKEMILNGSSEFIGEMAIVTFVLIRRQVRKNKEEKNYGRISCTFYSVICGPMSRFSTS